LKHRIWLDKRDADFMLTHSSEDITFENLVAWGTKIALWRFLAETPPA
jgi:primase-polymerase (primpol)-like protein